MGSRGSVSKFQLGGSGSGDGKWRSGNTYRVIGVYMGQAYNIRLSAC
jgi:hypothetical protein